MKPLSSKIHGSSCGKLPFTPRSRGDVPLAQLSTALDDLPSILVADDTCTTYLSIVISGEVSDHVRSLSYKRFL